MEYQLYIFNRSDGPFKVPFKEGTSREVMAKVNAIIPVGKKCLIPSDVVDSINMDRLNYHVSKHEIRVVEKKVRIPRMGTETPKPLGKKNRKFEKEESEIVEVKGAK
jgi:hypothetical protein